MDAEWGVIVAIVMILAYALAWAADEAERERD